MKKYYIYTRKMNEDRYSYLQEVFEDDTLDEDNLFSFLLQLPETKITVVSNEKSDKESEAIVSTIHEAAEDNDNLLVEETDKNIVVLDINKLNELKHEYLKEIFDFPDYYGKNLDALYDCLSELDDTEIVITNMKDIDDFSLNVINVFNDVMDEYNNLTITYLDEDEEDSYE